jgi:Lysyl oxidase/WD40-like Beta Propeller Repeat
MRRVFLLSFASLLVAPAADAALSARPVIAVATGAGIVLVDPERGERTAVPGTVAGDHAPALAPDGRRLAFSSRRNGNFELYVLDLWTGALSRLTANPRAVDTAPVWSPAGATLAWASGRPGAFDVYVMRADGSRKRRVAGAAANETEPDWAPNGARIVFSSNALGDADLWTVAAAGGEPAPLADLPGDELRPAWSPDGRRIAFAHAAAGRTVVETMQLADTGTRGVAATLSDTGAPSWSPNGRYLAVVSARGGAGAIRFVSASGSPPGPIAGLGRGDDDPDWGLLTPPTGHPARPGERLPDLDQRAPHDLQLIRRGSRTLLGFDSAVDNLGGGPLWIRGSRSGRAASMRADQLVRLGGGGVRIYRSVGSIRYTPHPPHYHWHFAPFERFELRRASDFALAARDRKIGFCLADHYGHAAGRARAYGPPRFLGDCGKGRRELRTVEQGSSPGYTDRYRAFFHGQNVDVTHVPAGLYVLVHRANPDLLAHELRYDNNAASVLLRLSRTRREVTVRVLAVCQERERCPPRI